VGVTLVLAVDTSGPAVTAALHDGHAVLAVASHHDPRRHAELLAPAIAQVLAEAGRTVGELTDVAVGVGPGPFTGLRVGVVTARMLGAALGIAVHGLCSLDALALAAPPGPAEFVVATDARRREVHWARYHRDGAGRAVRDDGPHVARPADVETAGLPVIGRGAALYPDLLPGPPLPAGQLLDVDAGALATLAARALAPGADPADVAVLLPPEPLYLRRPDAVEPGARKRVLQ
jgi:tRNA threonylcarbamoyladenosine biosynthesis protein TsaB